MNGSDNDSEADINGDSRLRPPEEVVDTGLSRKPAGVNDNVHFKILVPSIAAGAIIGKGGQAVAQIQKETGAKVKMSKTSDYYPGTTERVCLILGTVEAITRMHNYIMERIIEKPETNLKQPTEGRPTVERHKQVKILVPNSTAGMIIGKGGSFIKDIKERSGAFVQISQKSKEVNLPERCIVIAGEMEQNRSAVGMILAKIAEDPQSASCPNISYADVTGPVASAYPTGSPYANSGPSGTGSSSGSSAGTGTGGQTALATMGAVTAAGVGSHYGLQTASGGQPGYATPGAGGHYGLRSASPAGGAFTMDSIKAALRYAGYTDQATEEIANAMQVLGYYGFINMNALGGVGMGGPGMSPVVQQSLGGGPPPGAPVHVNVPPMGHLSHAGPPTPGGFVSAASPPTFSTSLLSPASSFNLGTPTSHLFQTAQRGPQAGGPTGPLFTEDLSYFFSAAPVNTPPELTPYNLYSPPLHQGPPPGGAPSMGPTGGLYGAPTPPDWYTTALAAAAATSLPMQPSPLLAGTAAGPAVTMAGQGGPTSAAEYLSSVGFMPPEVQREMEVSEYLVGALFCAGGKGLEEIEQQTRTSIQVTKKGSYYPGTRNRIVTVMGREWDVIQALNLIQMRLEAESTRRHQQQQHGSVSGSQAQSVAPTSTVGASTSAVPVTTTAVSVSQSQQQPPQS